MEKYKSRILIGEPGTGKTLIAPLLATTLGLGEVVDEYDPGTTLFKSRGVLYVANGPTQVADADTITVWDAVQLIHERLLELEAGVSDD